MQIIGFNLDKIHVERKNFPKGKIQISSNVNIKHISQEKLEMIKDQSTIKFNFEFIVSHNPNIAEITILGSVLALTTKEGSKEIFKRWKDKKIPENVRLPILNYIFNKCNLRALQFEEEFNLPAHFPLPQFKSQEENNRNYTG